MVSSVPSAHFHGSLVATPVEAMAVTLVGTAIPALMSGVRHSNDEKRKKGKRVLTFKGPAEVVNVVRVEIVANI